MKRAEKLAAAVEMGRRGGKKRVPKGFSKMSKKKRLAAAKKGVAARKKKLSSEERREIARKAASARWAAKQTKDKN